MICGGFASGLYYLGIKS